MQNAIDLAHVLGIAQPRGGHPCRGRDRQRPDAVHARCRGAVQDGRARARSPAASWTARWPSTMRSARPPRRRRASFRRSPASADILVVPDLEAGNMLAKQLTFLAGAEAAGRGSRRPRADHPDQPGRQRATRLASCAAGGPGGAEPGRAGVRMTGIDPHPVQRRVLEHQIRRVRRRPVTWHGARRDRGSRRTAPHMLAARPRAGAVWPTTLTDGNRLVARSRGAARSFADCASWPRRASRRRRHRVVHGGADHIAPSMVTPALLRALEALTPLDPLHHAAQSGADPRACRRAPGLAAGRLLRHRVSPYACRRWRRGLPCRGDSAMPACAATAFTACPMNISPAVWRSKSPQLALGRVIAAHLGSGASLCALHRWYQHRHHHGLQRARRAGRWPRAAAASIPASCCISGAGT